jgi:uncharacterized protein YgiM (DUF1202 family)
MKLLFISLLVLPLTVACSSATPSNPDDCNGATFDVQGENSVIVCKTESDVAVPTTAATVPTAQPAKASTLAVATPNGEPLNLRDASGNVVAVLQAGTPVTATGKADADGYLPVTAEGVRGFVFAQYVGTKQL